MFNSSNSGSFIPSFHRHLYSFYYVLNIRLGKKQIWHLFRDLLEGMCKHI